MDFIVKSVASQHNTNQILKALNKKRRAARIEAVKIWAVRRAVKGDIHKRGAEETRGRKRKLDEAAMVRVLDERWGGHVT